MMGRQTGKRIALGMICFILLLVTGCSGKGEGNGSQSKNQDEVRKSEEAGNTNADMESEPEEEKELKQSTKPQFIPNGIRSVSLKRDGEEILHISREPAEYKMSFDYWEVLNPYDENATMNTEVMFEMFETLCSLSFDTPAQVEEGNDTGIQDSDMSFVVEYVDTQDDSVAQSTDDADAAAEIILGKEDGNGGRYAMVTGDEEQIYVIPDEIIQMVYGREPFDYILKIPVLISADTVKDVEITAGKKEYQIQVDTKANAYKFGKKGVDKKEFADLYQAISGVMVTSEIDKDGGSKKGEAELTVTFHRNMEGAPDVSMSFYAYDDESDLVEIDGEERFLVKKEEIDALVKQIGEAF